MELPTIEMLDELVDAIAYADRLGAHVALAAHRIAERGDWAADGAVSFRTWLRHRARLSQPRITALIRHGRFLARFGLIADAATTGRLPELHVTAIRDLAIEHRRPSLDEQQADVVDALAPEGEGAVDDDRLREFCQDWADKVDAEVDGPEPKQPERSFTLSRLPDGSAFGKFNLPADAANQLEQALQTAHSWDGAGDNRSPKTHNADAFDEIIRFFNANHTRTGSKRHHPNITLHINNNDLHDMRGPHATTPTGVRIPTPATDAYLCDCVIHRVVHTGSIITDYGRSVRSVPRHLFHAVAERDRGCRFPCCDRPEAWCDAHHIIPWGPPHNGETKLDKLALLCNRHHHHVHQHGWQMTLHPNSDIVFTTPDGRHLITRPHGSTGVTEAA